MDQKQIDEIKRQVLNEVVDVFRWKLVRVLPNTLRNRATHTGTQTASTISDFNAAVTASTHASNATNPHRVTKAQIGLSQVQNLKVNLTATTTPTNGSDETLGYTVGSSWVNTTTKNWYVCVDATAGRATWKPLNDAWTQSNPPFKPLVTTSAALIISDSRDQMTLDIDASKINISTLRGAPTGKLVGVDDTQLLLNKTISGASNRLSDIGDSSLLPRIDATKLSRGVVTNANFDTLTGATSNIQSQLNNKAAVTHSHFSTEITDLNTTIDARVESQKGIAGGLATLDQRGKIDGSQLTIDGGMIYKGSWNAATNFPPIVDGVGTKGDFLMVEVAGNFKVDGITGWQVGDSLIFNGERWEKFGTALTVNSVAGKQGSVTLEALDIASGTFSNDRISASSVIQHQGLINIEELLNAPTSKLMGATDVQTITNKTISGATNHLMDIPNASLAAGIDATKLGSGSVSNQRLNYLANLTSDVQAQLDSRSMIGHSHSAVDFANGVFVDARISQSSVVQYQSSFDSMKLIGAPTSTIVGIADAQVLSNKIIDGSRNSITGIGNDSLTGKIDATKLSTGEVTNHSFNCLSGVTVNLQTQLAGKAAFEHVHDAAEITSGIFDDERISESSVTQHFKALQLLNQTEKNDEGGSSKLKTHKGDVKIDGKPPVAGQVLMAINDSTVGWQDLPSSNNEGSKGSPRGDSKGHAAWKARATFQSATLNPAGTTSTAGVMMGLAGSITPVFDGKVMVIVTGSITNSLGNAGGKVQIRYGTSKTPGNGSALSGTLAGTPIEMSSATAATFPFTASAMIVGLATGVNYWLDVSLTSISAGKATLTSLGLIATE